MRDGKDWLFWENKYTPLYTFGNVIFNVMGHEVIRQLTQDTFRA